MLFEIYIQDKCNVEVQSEAMYILFVRYCQILCGLYSLAFLGWKDYSIYSNEQHLWVSLKFGVYYGVFTGLSVSYVAPHLILIIKLITTFHFLI